MPGAGWYGDPTDDRRVRYWDGDRWTDSTAERSPKGTAPEARAPADEAVDVTGRPGAAVAPAGASAAKAAPWAQRYRAVALVSALVLVAIVGWALLRSGGSGGSSPGSQQAYLQAAHADLAGAKISDSDLLDFGRVVCGTYEQHDNADARAKAVDRPDLVASGDLRRQLFGEALNHLCPQYQLTGIKPAPAPPGSVVVPTTSTTRPGSSVSIFSS